MSSSSLFSCCFFRMQLMNRWNEKGMVVVQNVGDGMLTPFVIWCSVGVVEWGVAGIWDRESVMEILSSSVNSAQTAGHIKGLSHTWTALGFVHAGVSFALIFCCHQFGSILANKWGDSFITGMQYVWAKWLPWLNSSYICNPRDVVQNLYIAWG